MIERVALPVEQVPTVVDSRQKSFGDVKSYQKFQSRKARNSGEAHYIFGGVPSEERKKGSARINGNAFLFVFRFDVAVFVVAEQSKIYERHDRNRKDHQKYWMDQGCHQDSTESESAPHPPSIAPEAAESVQSKLPFVFGRSFFDRHFPNKRFDILSDPDVAKANRISVELNHQR